MEIEKIYARDVGIVDGLPLWEIYYNDGDFLALFVAKTADGAMGQAEALIDLIKDN